MLIVGEAAMPDVKLEDIEFTELIVSNDKVDNLKAKLKLEGVSPLSVSSFSRLFYRKADNRRFIFHLVGNNFQLLRLVNAHSAKHEIKVATPAMNYVFMWTLQNTKFRNPMMWASKLKQIKKLRPYFERDFHSESFNLKQRHIGKYIGHYLSKLNVIDNKSFQYSDFEYVSKYVLVNLVSSEVTKGDRAYNRMTITHIDHFYVDNIFHKAMTDVQRRHAMMDKLYIDTINEYFIPNLVVEFKAPKRSEWKKLFVNSIMNVYTMDNPDHDFFREYIYNNIEKIVDNYEHGAFDTFLMAYKKKSIKLKK